MTDQREPSVSSLADALSRTSTAQQPAEQRVAIARPRPLLRVLIAAVLLLGLIFVAALLVLGERISGLVVEVRAERAERDRREREDLPEEAILRDASATRQAALARPLAAGNIWHARCELLARAGDWAAVDVTCVQVGLDSPGDLLPETRMLHAEALHRLGHDIEAGRVLRGVDPQVLDETGRIQAARLASQLYVGDERPLPSVEGPTEKPGEAAPEGADHLDAR